jgi:hypothetical protein
VNNFEDTVFGGIHVVSDAHLTRSAAVDSAALEAKLLRRAKFHDVVGALSIVDATALLTWVIATIAV